MLSSFADCAAFKKRALITLIQIPPLFEEWYRKEEEERVSISLAMKIFLRSVQSNIVICVTEVNKEEKEEVFRFLKPVEHKSENNARLPFFFS